MTGLKIMFASMVVLVVGALILIGAVVTGKAGPNAACVTDRRLDLTAEGIPMRTVWKDRELRLTIPGQPGTTKLLTVDTCKAEITSRLMIVTAVPPMIEPPVAVPSPAPATRKR